MMIILWIVFVLVCGSILVFAAGKRKNGATKKKKKPISQGNLLRSIDNIIVKRFHFAMGDLVDYIFFAFELK